MPKIVYNSEEIMKIIKDAFDRGYDQGKIRSVCGDCYLTELIATGSLNKSPEVYLQISKIEKP